MKNKSDLGLPQNSQVHSHGASTAGQASGELARSLGFRDAIGLVIGTVIGTGVFLKASIMAQQVGSPILVLIAWLVAGVLSLIGALCYAELGSLFPRAGGEYVFLREAYGELLAFLYGWMRFWIGTPGSIAAYAVGAATFLSGVSPFHDPMTKTWIAIGFILFFSLLNCLAVVFGAAVQSALTALKIIMIVGLAVAILFFGHASAGFGESFLGHTGSGLFAGWSGWSAFGSAMLAALWAYDGWNNMPMAAGEIQDPQKNIPRALAIGMATVLGLYLLLNFSYFSALSFSQIQNSYSSAHPHALPVATQAAQLCFGTAAVVILSIAFVISALGAMNGSILTGARVPYAMARDGMFFKSLARVGKINRVPFVAVLVQAVVASVLAMSGTFDQLTDYVVFAGWIFYALVTASLFIFRRRQKNGTSVGDVSVGPAMYRVPLFPLLPLIFVFASVLLLANTVVTSPRESLTGLGFIVVGIPAFYVFSKSSKRRG